MSYFDQPRRNTPRRHEQTAPFSRPNRPVGEYRASTPTAEVLRGRVKWFSAEKGFGFVALEDGTDVFLHGSVLASNGVSVAPGDMVRVGVGQGMKGRQITEVLEVKAAAVSPERSAPVATERARQAADVGVSHATAGSRVRGVVKWWNEQKGFGFITPEVGTKDIFVHASVAAHAGLSLATGMPVKVKVRQGEKGPEAVEIAAA